MRNFVRTLESDGEYYTIIRYQATKVKELERLIESDIEKMVEMRVQERTKRQLIVVFEKHKNIELTQRVFLKKLNYKSKEAIEKTIHLAEKEKRVKELFNHRKEKVGSIVGSLGILLTVPEIYSTLSPISSDNPYVPELVTFSLGLGIANLGYKAAQIPVNIFNRVQFELIKREKNSALDYLEAYGDLSCAIVENYKIRNNF